MMIPLCEGQDRHSPALAMSVHSAGLQNCSPAPPAQVQFSPHAQLGPHWQDALADPHWQEGPHWQDGPHWQAAVLVSFVIGNLPFEVWTRHT